MKPPEEVKLEFVKQWVDKAEIDFHTAEHPSKSGERDVYAAAFHAQQAAEKYLKALLVWHQIEFKKIHDLAVLLRLASHADPDIAGLLREAENLTPYGVEYRYPGDYPHVTVDQVQEALRIASQVRTEVRSRLPHNALPQEN